MTGSFALKGVSFRKSPTEIVQGNKEKRQDRKARNRCGESEVGGGGTSLIDGQTDGLLPDGRTTAGKQEGKEAVRNCRSLILETTHSLPPHSNTPPRNESHAAVD